MNCECPYCLKESRHDIEDYDQGELVHLQCDRCEKHFTANVYISIELTSPKKADCLNGGEHDMQPVHYHPKGLYVKYDRCTMCGEEEKIINKNFKL